MEASLGRERQAVDEVDVETFLIAGIVTPI
jgi:hypothetical protein